MGVIGNFALLDDAGGTLKGMGLAKKTRNEVRPAYPALEIEHALPKFSVKLRRFYAKVFVGIGRHLIRRTGFHKSREALRYIEELRNRLKRLPRACFGFFRCLRDI